MVILRVIKDKVRRLSRPVRDLAYRGVTEIRVVLRRILNVFARGPGTDRRVLFVDEMLPDARLGAGFPRAAEIVDAMIAAGWRVSHYAKISSSSHRRDMHERFRGAVDFLPSRGLLGLKRVLRERRSQFDAMFVSRPSTMDTLEQARRESSIKLPFLIYDAEAIFAEREMARLALEGLTFSEDERDDRIRSEIALTAKADAIVTVCDADAETFRHHTRMPVWVVSHATSSSDRFADAQSRGEIVIVGKVEGPREASPNLDSIMWYIEEVAPILRDTHGISVPLTVVGPVSADAKALLADAPVRWAGVVDDLASVYNRARVMVAPTRFSAGIPLKVVEAAAAGVPCVVTERIGRQVGFTDDVQARVAGCAESFARACADLYRDDEQWHRLRDAAWADVNRRFSRAHLQYSVAELLDAAVPPRPPARRAIQVKHREPTIALATSG